MEEHFHQSKKLEKDQLKMLMQKSDNPAVIRFIIMYLLFLATSVCVVLTWTGPLWQIVLTQIAFGILFGVSRVYIQGPRLRHLWGRESQRVF